MLPDTSYMTEHYCFLSNIYFTYRKEIKTTSYRNVTLYLKIGQVP